MFLPLDKKNFGPFRKLYNIPLPTVIWALTVAIQYTKIMSRPDICTVRAYALSRRLYRPGGCSLSGCNRLTRQVVQVESM